MVENWAKYEAFSSKRYGTLKQRFYNAVIPEPNSGCWLYGEGYDGDDGYIKIRIGDWRDKVHRLSWRVHNGPIPPGQQVLHKCDVPCCVNPDHLFLGTAEDNVADKVSKNRQAKGIGHPCSKLTEDNVRYIRGSDETNRALGRRFNVSHGIINNIKKGIDWKHIK
jgi:HNH endonuclease